MYEIFFLKCWLVTPWEYSLSLDLSVWDLHLSPHSPASLSPSLEKLLWCGEFDSMTPKCPPALIINYSSVWVSYESNIRFFILFFLNQSLSHCVVYQQSSRNIYLEFQGKQAVVSIPLEMYFFLSLLNPHFSVSWDCNHLLLDIFLLLLSTVYFFMCYLPVIYLFFFPEDISS